MAEKLKTSPKDFFLHVLSIITLYFSAGAYLTLVFQYINVLFPDPLADAFRFRGSFSAIRWAISTLIIVFPVYIWSIWVLNKDYKKEPAKRNLWIRKWLIYFTIFAAAGFIIGDLVVLVNNLLEGELTLRFALKVIAVLFVAGSIFGYYLSDIKKIKSKGRQVFAYIIIGVLAAHIVAGFFIVGSPKEERLRRFDEQRVGHLQFLQSEILNYWIRRDNLPPALQDLESDIRGVTIPTDPVTGESYGYEVRGDLVFALCANFSLPSLEAEAARVPKPVPVFEPHIGPFGVQNWEHDAGLVCFERTIDPEFYEDIKKQ